MRKMIILLSRSSRREKRFLYLSYTMDVFLISMVFMIVDLLRLTSLDLSESDVGQSMFMAMGVILVALILVIFFLWIIAMEFKGLYDSREIFNRNVKIMGYPGRKLIVLYLIEMLLMQIPSIAGGCILGAVVYHIYAVKSAEVILFMKPGIMCAAVVIHLLILLLTVAVVGGKCVGQSVVTEIRKQRKERKSGIILQLVIAVVMIIVIQMICNRLQTQMAVTDALRYSQAVKLAYLAVIAVGIAPVMKLIFVFVDVVCKKMGAFHFVISLKLLKCFWRRFMVMIFLIIFSGAFFCALYTLFGITRESADALSRESIHYAGYYIYDRCFPRTEEKDERDTFYTLRYRSTEEGGGHIWLTGITGDYLEQYETFQTAEVTENGKSGELTDEAGLSELLESEDFDGIILDDLYQGMEGETIVLNVNGTEIPFTIYTTVLSHDCDRIDAYVSRAYLEKQLGAEGLYNTVYYMKNSEEISTDHVVLAQTNEDIWEENYQHVVQGTETMELVFWMILICSMFAVCTCLAMSGRDNQRTFAHLQGLGAEKRVLVKIYLFQSIWILICTVLPVVFLAYLLAKGIAYLLMNPGYYFLGFHVEPWVVLLLFSVYLVISIAVQLLMLRKTTKDAKYIKILRG